MAELKQLKRSRLQFTIRTLLLATTVFAVLFTVCFYWQPWLSERERNHLLKAQRFERADIPAEVQAALQRGDERYIGISEDRVYAPAIKDNLPQDRLFVIAGTSDAIECSSHRKFQRAAYQYAKQYNTLLKAHLDEKLIRQPGAP